MNVQRARCDRLFLAIVLPKATAQMIAGVQNSKNGDGSTIRDRITSCLWIQTVLFGGQYVGQATASAHEPLSSL